MRLVNLGSYVFCAVASCGWQNTEVPKFAVGRGGKSGLYLLETVIWEYPETQQVPARNISERTRTVNWGLGLLRVIVFIVSIF